METLLRHVTHLCVPVFGLTRPGLDRILYTSALINRHVAWYEHVNTDCGVSCGTSIVSTGVGRPTVPESGNGLPTSCLGTSNNRFMIDIHFDIARVKNIVSCNYV